MKANPTRAAVIEPVETGTLSPLLERRSFGLLPLANRPLLDGLLANLAEAGIHEVDLYLACHPEQTRALVGAGEAWGLTLRCHSIGDTRRLWQRPRRCLNAGGDTLVLGMELDVNVAKLLGQAARCHRSVRFVDGRDRPLPALVLRSDDPDESTALRWAGDPIVRILTPQSFWQANLARLAGLRETNHTENRLRDDLYLGPGCRLHESAQLSEAALVGSHSVLARNVVLGPRSIIGRRCYLDESVELSGSLVLDGSYVGPHACLNGKIVDQYRMLDIESGAVAYIDDASLLGSSAEVLDGDLLVKRGYEWVLSLLALLLSLPILAGWIVLRWLHGQSALEREVLYVPVRRALDGQMLYRQLDLFSLAGVRHGARRRLPWLLGVLGRKLHLVGAELPMRKPRAELADAGRIYGMLQWRPTEDLTAPGIALSAADYLPNAGLGFSLRVLWAWFVQMTKPEQQGVQT